MADLCSIFNKITGCETREDIIPSKDPKARYSRIRIRLYDSFTDKEFYLSGSFIGVASITGGATCQLRLDHIHAEEINLREVEEIRSNFNRIYITTDGAGGVVTLYICQSMETIISADKKTVFTGLCNNYSYVSTNTVRRVSPNYHYKANRIRIRNTHATYAVELGTIISKTSVPSTAIFRSWSYRLIAQEAIEFTHVDLFHMGFVSTVDDAHVNLKMMASLE